MSYLVGQGSNVTSSYNLTTQSFEYIEAGFYDTKYPNFYWNRMIEAGSIDTKINIGARQAAYVVKDKSGMGSFVNGASNNIPTVLSGIGKTSIPIEMAAVSAIVTEDEARQVQFGHSINMITDQGSLMREASERHIEKVFFFGNVELGFDSFIDNPTVDISAASTKAAGGTAWELATADEIIDDVNSAISLISEDTRQIAYAGNIILPTRQYNRLATLRISNTNESVLQYLKINNVYTANTGEDLQINAIPYTNDVAVGLAAGLGRMIVKVKSVRNDWLPMPETANLRAPQQEGLNTKLYSTYTFGPYHNRYPAEMIYVDGI